jgi:pimeloyl-ACP methyl ester carboxylesterase
LARDLASHGHLALRIDYHGTGDSSGVLTDRGFSGQTARDLDEAVTWLADQADEVVVVGTCWGGLLGVATAARQPVLTAVYLISSPLHLLERTIESVVVIGKETTHTEALRQVLAPRTVRRLARDPDYRRWLSHRARRRLSRMRRNGTGARVPVLPEQDDGRQAPGSVLYPQIQRSGVVLKALFGELDGYYQEFTAPGATPLADAHPGLVDVVVEPGLRVHGLTSLAAQDVVRERVVAWLDETRPRRPASRQRVESAAGSDSAALAQHEAGERAD